MRIILAGIIGRYPWGGVTWCSLMYLLGLRKLGHDVYYIEDTCECNYDPEINAIAVDPKYALNYIHQSLSPFGFGDRWCYIDYKGGHHGMTREACEEICESADLFLVLSGGCWIWRDHYLEIPVKVFIDSDPAFTQRALEQARQADAQQEKKQWYVDFFRTYDRLFTMGGNIGFDECDTPVAGFDWFHILQPVDTEIWTPNQSALPSREEWTTVMSWSIHSFKDIGGYKDQEFLKVLDLSRRCAERGGPALELAINGPMELLREHGWRCVDANGVSSDLWRYHGYLSTSRGEFGVAKHTYVESQCGWFSDRTECYMAAGRPAVVQDTNFATRIPAGEGLFAWKTADDAIEALLAVEADYDRHSRAARELAMEYFDSRRVLCALLDRCS